MSLITSTSSENQTPYRVENAREKYNDQTVVVYEDGAPPLKSGEVNAKVYYPSESITNISIDRSLDITPLEEQAAVLDVIIASPYYHEEVFGDRDFMQAQWIVHNECYKLAVGSDVGYQLAKLISGADDPIVSSQSLDIRSLNNLTDRQKAIYTMVAWFI